MNEDDLEMRSSAWEKAKMAEMLAKIASGGFGGAVGYSPGGVIDSSGDLVDKTTYTDYTYIGPPLKPPTLTPDEALDVILNAIRKVAGGDPDNMLELTGLWISKVTNALTQLNKEVSETEEGSTT